MKYIIDMPEGTVLPCLCFMLNTCKPDCVFSRLTPCPLGGAKGVLTLEEYQKANPKRPTGNEVQEIYVVEKVI